MFSINSNDWELARKLLADLYLRFDDLQYAFNDVTKYKTLRILAYLTSVRDTIRPHIEYAKLFSTNRLLPPSLIDIEIFVYLIFELTSQKKYHDALKYVEIIKAARSLTQQAELIHYLLVYHLELNLYLYMGENKNAISSAHEIILLANDDTIKNQKSKLLGETGFDIIKRNAETIVNPQTLVSPVRVNKPYGRNQHVKVRYKDGTILETKYKKIEGDLSNGKCFILNSE